MTVAERHKSGFHSNVRNACKVLRKKKYARNAINARKLRKQKHKYGSASHATDASGPCTRKRNDRIDSIFHATQAFALRALRAFEWKPGLGVVVADKSMFSLPDRGRCQCVRAEVVCAKSFSSRTHKPGTVRLFLIHSQ